MSGTEKSKLLVISNSANPRCFKSIQKTNLPVYYRHNQKAWMDASIFKEWLLKRDNQLKSENRKILLFLDNFSGHKLQLITVTEDNVESDSDMEEISKSEKTAISSKDPID